MTRRFSMLAPGNGKTRTACRAPLKIPKPWCSTVSTALKTGMRSHLCTLITNDRMCRERRGATASMSAECQNESLLESEWPKFTAARIYSASCRESKPKIRS